MVPSMLPTWALGVGKGALTRLAAVWRAEGREVTLDEIRFHLRAAMGGLCPSSAVIGGWMLGLGWDVVDGKLARRSRYVRFRASVT